MEGKKLPQGTYLVVIPFFKGGAQGREIEYCIAGWRMHFKEKYLIVVVGDYHPVVDSGDDIIFIECERVGPASTGNYRPHLDFVKKFKEVRKHFPKEKGFIFCADDVYAVNNFDINDIKFLKQRADNLNDYLIPISDWQKEKKKTRALLVKEGLPTRNYTTHLPVWFDWDKIEELWDKYDMDNNSYCIEDLYFNTYFKDRIPLQMNIDYDNLKCGVYRANPRWNYIENALHRQIWIQNSVEGWTARLDSFLARYYGL